MTAGPGPARTPARRKARQLAKYLRAERPDYAYLKEVFRHLREELAVKVARAPKKLPYVPTEAEIRAFYDAVWKARRAGDVILIKTLLYRPAAGDPGTWPRLEPALTRPIRWDLIAAQYDQMIKYATAIRTGTASTQAILRRFTKANAIHPAYQAMAETGRAQRTIFIARYLRDRDLQREIGEGLNVVES